MQNMPSWAEGNATTFFTEAAARERAGGRWATAWQLSLPRDLSTTEQQGLVQDWVEGMLPQRAALWVLHEPQASDGGAQPHTHILFSERLQDGEERSPEQYFRRPEVGGLQKHVFGEGDRQAPYRLREAWTVFVNVHLERAGSTDYLDPRSRHVRGVTRAAVQERYDAETGEVTIVDERTPRTRAVEARMAQQWWTARKAALGITDVHALDNGALITRLHAYVRTPDASQQGLQAPTPTWTTEAHDTSQVIGNRRSWIYHRSDDLNIREISPRHAVYFTDEAEATAAGFRRARNRHYALGIERLAEARTTVEQQIDRLTTFHHAVHQETLLAELGERHGQPVTAAAQDRLEGLETRGRALGVSVTRVVRAIDDESAEDSPGGTQWRPQSRGRESHGFEV